jgi:hypothetical protein
MRTTLSPFISAFNEHPTPQYAQVVVTARSGSACARRVFSCSAVVGHASTQAPHETHSEARKLSPWLAATREAKPRPSMVSANVPCTSSHARTQREHTMHALGSKRK